MPSTEIPLPVHPLPADAPQPDFESVAEQARKRLRGLTQPDEPRASVAFLTVQGAMHTGRHTGYLNTVFSVRVGSTVGSCAVEPGQLDEQVARETAGCRVVELLSHPHRAVRVAALDAYLADLLPHNEHPGARAVRIPAGDSLRRSMTRARAVVALLPAAGRVAVIGVVNSLLSALRERGVDYSACDLKGGRTEWGEPILREHTAAIEPCQAVLASGMVLGNDTFDEISALCRARGLPLVVFAQTGGAVLRQLLGHHLYALSAEPYPFFWLTGDAGDIYTYLAGAGARR